MKDGVNMKITVLGTAAATSFPLAFCKCEICKSARINGSKDFRRRSSIVINDDLLVDMGPDCVTSSFLYGIDISNIKYLVQTHPHSDHFDGGIFVTRHKEYATSESNHLDIICSQKTFSEMNVMVKRNEPSYDLNLEQNKSNMNFDYIPIKKDQIVKVGNYTIHAIDSLHDPRLEALIYIITFKNKNILYATDLLKLNDEAWDILKKYKLDVIFIDQTYGKGYNAGGHTDAEIISNYILKMKNEAIIDNNTLIYATHISHEGNNVHSIMEKEAINNGYHIAYDGMIIEL